MKATLPNLKTPAVDDNGAMSGAWVSFFTALVASAGPIIDLAVPASPASLEAPADGQFVVTAGGVSATSLTRGRRTIPLGQVAGCFPVSQGDVLHVTFSSPPSVRFVPA
jgi:hypothetical protein